LEEFARASIFGDCDVLTVWEPHNPFLVADPALSKRFGQRGNSALTISSQDISGIFVAMADSGKQIKQMVNFIMQEAHEKVNEIRIKVRIFATWDAR
jgi:hypothetical protein